jgi:hypothetical protein
MTEPKPQTEESRLQEQASNEYPGPRKASTGERVSPDPADPPQPAGAGAREGRPAAGGGEPRDGRAEESKAGMVPPGRDAKGR